jgi:hypothetical protein
MVKHTVNLFLTPCEKTTMPLRLSDRVRRSAVERVFRTRMMNVRLLVRNYKNKSEFARALGVDPSFITHICGESPRRTIGESLARNIESKMGLHQGWLDIAR